MITAGFFRSTSLGEDLHHPERFSHYRPTRRAMPIVEAIAAPGSSMVIAPYGSGKSLAAGISALHVRNAATDRDALQPVLRRLAVVDPASARRFQERAAGRTSGGVVVLTGHVPDPLAAISAALGLDRVSKSVEGLASGMRGAGSDHVAVIWDEFGRHLEGLVGDGRADDLDIVQRLAERAARAVGPTLSLTLLLHQNLLAYATRLNEASRSEWRKVEGRFAAIRMVEDSQEIYRLIGDIVEALRPPHAATAKKPEPATVEEVIAAKWLDGMTDQRAVGRVLAAARPLTPGALQVLPALVARVGQNERSLFSFLQEADLSREVGIEAVYAAFSDAMRTDVGLGGAYRRWLETEGARSRAPGPLHREVLAAACLMQLGTSGERRRLPRRILELAVSTPRRDVSRAVDELIAAKLLIWRRHNDDVAVWHGADIDAAYRVREERERRAESFDLLSFLDVRFPAPYVRAPRHNAHYGVNRFLAGRYLTARQVVDGTVVDAADDDGVIVYVIARDRAEIKAARQAVKAMPASRAIYVVPHQPLLAEATALEVVCLEALKADQAFIGSDPMALTEVEELESVAFEQFATLMRSLLDPRGQSAGWYSGGLWIDVSTDRPGTMAASALFDAWFDSTPRIANEQLMRPHASRTMQTARVRVVGAILEGSDRERLGYEPGDRSAEGSIYRTVLEKTGLFRSGARLFADVEEVGDPGLRLVWATIADFFRIPTAPGERRPLTALLVRLADRPMGVPRGVMPLLVAAGFRRFARAVAVYRGGVYVADMLGFAFDQMVMEPDAFDVRVERADIPLTDYLREVCYAFTHERPGAGEELVRCATDAIERWKATIPEAARRTQRLGPSGKALLDVLGAAADPVDLLVSGLPRAVGLDGPDHRVVSEVERARKDVDALHDIFAAEAVATVEEAFRARGADAFDLLSAVKAWAGCFDPKEMERRPDLRISDKAVVRKAVETANGRFSPKSFAGALSSILLQRGLDKWEDRTAQQFRAALREARERIEAAALDTAQPGEQLRPILSARIAELNALMAKLDGGRPHAEVKLVNGSNR